MLDYSVSLFRLGRRTAANTLVVHTLNKQRTTCIYRGTHRRARSRTMPDPICPQESCAQSAQNQTPLSDILGLVHTKAAAGAASTLFGRVRARCLGHDVTDWIWRRGLLEESWNSAVRLSWRLWCRNAPSENKTETATIYTTARSYCWFWAVRRCWGNFETSNSGCDSNLRLALMSLRRRGVISDAGVFPGTHGNKLRFFF